MTINPIAISTYDELLSLTTNVASSTTKVIMPAKASGVESSVIASINVPEACSLQIATGGTGLTTSLEAQLYSDQTCTLKVGTSIYLGASSLVGSKTVDINAPGTYYLKYTYTSNYTTTTNTIPLGVNVMMIKNELDLTGTPTLFHDTSRLTASYHKIVVNKRSLVTVAGNSYNSSLSAMYSLSFSLTDESKVDIDSYNSLSETNQYMRSYVLNPGTYYIVTKNSVGFAQLAYQAKPVGKAPTTKKKAKTLKKNKAAYGSFSTSDAKNAKQVFKIVLKKKKSIKFVASILGGNAGSLRWNVERKGGGIIFGNSGTIYAERGGGAKSKGKMKKGTYYLTISKYSDNDSAQFAVKLKS
jgi:hypothetical protein